MSLQLHFSMSSKISPFIFFLCALLVNYTTGFAQGTNSNATDTTKVIKVIEPIALADIGTETEATLLTIRNIREKIKPTNSDLELDTLIPQKLVAVEKLKKELVLEEIEKMNLRQTEGLKNDISQLRNQLDNWRSTLKKNTEETNAMKADLGDVKTMWDETLKLDREEKLPKQVKERIQTNLKEINTLNKDLTKRYNALLTRQDEMTGALIYLDEVLNTIIKTEQDYRTQIFVIDSPPIWQIFSVKLDTLTPEQQKMVSAEADTLTFKQSVQDIITRQNSDFKGFLKNYQANIYYHILFFVVLLLLSFYLKFDIAKWSDEKRDETIKSSLHVISKPFSASLLVSLLASGLFYSEAPENVLNYYYVLLVVPILTIVPGLIPGINKRYFYFVGGVFVFAQVADYFSGLVILERSILLFLDILTIVLLITLLRSKGEIRERSPNVKWGFAFTIMRLSIFLLSISALANSLGNTTLSRIVSQGSLVMIYGGIIIYASAIILKGLFALIIQLDTVSRLNMIQNYADEVKKRTFRLIRLAGILYWLYITLSGYLIFDSIFNWLVEFITTEWTISEKNDSSISIWNFLAFFITLWISMLVSRFVRFILQDEILTHFEMPRGVPGAISLLVKITVMTLGIIIAFGAASIDLSQITILIGALGVGIGFGLQNIFNNLISGLILAFERPIQTGDIIQIATLNLMGEVKEIGIRASTIRTFDGAEVIVPNGNLISNEVINWTLSDQRKRQEILVGVTYGTDIAKVLEILNTVVIEQKNVLKNPAPFNIFVGFGDSSLNFRVLFWTPFDVGMGTKSRVGIAIDEAFKKVGIEIPFPQRDLHLRSISDDVDFKMENKSTGSTTKKGKGAKSTSDKNTSEG